MNLMMLINSLLDINCQVIIKRATILKLKLFHQLNTPKVHCTGGFDGARDSDELLNPTISWFLPFFLKT